MGLNPGSVSVFGLLNDDNQEVELYLDQGVLEADFVTFHPNDNTATVSLAREQFMNVLEKLSRDFKKLK